MNYEALEIVALLWKFGKEVVEEKSVDGDMDELGLCDDEKRERKMMMMRKGTSLLLDDNVMVWRMMSLSY